MAYYTARADDGVRLSYDRHGAGDSTVCVISGHPLSARAVQCAEAVIAVRDQLAAERTLVIAETRGAGRAQISGPFTLAQMADDVAAILRHIDRPPNVLWGNRSGALVALSTAVAYPELVTGVILDTPAMTDAVTALMGGADPAFLHMTVEQFEAAIRRALIASVGEGTHGASDAERERIAQEFRRSAPLAVWKESFAAAIVDLTERLAALERGEHVPAQLVLALTPEAEPGPQAGRILAALRARGGPHRRGHPGLVPPDARSRLGPRPARDRTPASSILALAAVRPWLQRVLAAA